MYLPASKPALWESLVSELATKINPSEAEFDDLADHLYILNKKQQVVRFAPNRAQLHYRKHLAGRNLLLKARQLGFSTDIQARGFEEAMQRTTLMATLAHDDKTTQKLRRMARRFYDYLPDSLRPDRGLDNATTTTYPQTQSEITIATAGSSQVGRGGTYSRLHGSEVAFWKDAASIVAGIVQGVPNHGLIELESSAFGAQGWFYERCMAALDGDSDWKLHFYEWWWDERDYRLELEDGESLVYTDEEQFLIHRVTEDSGGEFALTPEQIKWRRKKQRELGRLFPQEYAEDPRTCFLVSGAGYFSDIHDLDKKFNAPVDAVYNLSHRYLAALDFGQQQDYSAMSVIDATTLEEVEIWRVNRIAWGDIRARVLATCFKWHIEALHPEKNSMGGTNIEELHKEFARAGCHTSIVPFETTPQSKPSMVTGFHWALDEGGLKLLPDPIYRQEIYGFTASQTPNGSWRYEGLPHDDTVIARIGAWNAVVLGNIQLGRSVQKWG